jgi:acyl-CoA synthetase (NDP forming)
MTHLLDSFFAPQSIAVIGASRDGSRIPGQLLAYLRKNGFAGAIYPVNPNYPDIDGLKCWPAVASIGAPIDLAVVTIPAKMVLGALEECAKAGVRNAIIISSGFAEEGGESALTQAAITALARRTGMRICGPNAQGYFNEPLKIAATFSPTVDVKPGLPRLVATTKRIGIAAQSGGIGFAICHRAQAIGVALSIVISTGNECDLGVGEVLDYMVQDDSTDVILLFIEGIRDIERFDAAARRAAAVGKAVIVTKVGRSAAGARASELHTASVAGSPTAYDAMFAKYGFIVSHDMDEAVTIAAVLTTTPSPKGDRVAIVTTSGGGGIWAADALSMAGLRLPELSEAMQSDIRKLIPSYGAARNPVDVTAQAVHSGGLQKTVEMLSMSDEVDAILVVVSLASDTRIPFKAAELKPVLDELRKPVLFWSYTLPSTFARTGFAECGAVVLSSLSLIATALRKVTTRSLMRENRSWLGKTLPTSCPREGGDDSVLASTAP